MEVNPDKVDKSYRNNPPLISAVIPTRNRPDLVLRAVNSALSQTYTNLEVIVVVDGPDSSTVSKLEALRESRLRVIELPDNVGGAGARNIGVQEAAGEWIALLDDDDEWLPEKISKQAALIMRSDPSVNFIVCRCVVRRPGMDVIRPRRLPLPGENLGEYSYCVGEPLLFPSSGLIKKTLLIAVPFSKGIRTSDDHDWLMRATEAGAIVPGWMDDVLAIVYAGGHTSGSNRYDNWEDIYRFALKYRGTVLTPRAFSYCLLREGLPAIKRSKGSVFKSSRDLMRFLFAAIFIGRIDARFCAYFLMIAFLGDNSRRKLSSIRDQIKGRKKTATSQLIQEAPAPLPNRPRILLVDVGVSFAGVEVYLENLVSILKPKSELFALCVNPELGRSLRRSGVHVFMAPSFLGKPAHLLIGLALLLKLRLMSGINRVWVNGGPEIVLLPWARLLGCTTIATCHGTLDIEVGVAWRLAWKRRVTRFIYKNLLFTANKVFCVSEAVAADLSQVVSQEKLVVIPNWVRTLPPPVERLSRDGRPLRLLFIGRLIKLKGAALILEAIGQIKEFPLSLTIVGEGEYEQDLKLRAEGLNVQFAGFHQDPSIFYRDADVFINPTLGPEGLPMVSLEAMSYGLPCILSDLKVHREISSDGESALLFQCGNSLDLRTKIESFISMPELLTNYGRRGRSTIEEKYCVRAAGPHYIKELGI